MGAEAAPGGQVGTIPPGCGPRRRVRTHRWPAAPPPRESSRRAPHPGGAAIANAALRASLSVAPSLGTPTGTGAAIGSPGGAPRAAHAPGGSGIAPTGTGGGGAPGGRPYGLNPGGGAPIWPYG